MVQSLNTKAELATQGISYLGMGAKYGKILVGDKAFEFFNDNNIEDYIQIPWTNVIAVYTHISGDKVSRRFKIKTDKIDLNFSSKSSGKLLKIMREHLGNDKILRSSSLWDKIRSRFKYK
ncbi:PTS mannose transporter accessory protein ManO [Leuconostoc litchii]|uniref:DUF956 family protein n=1 Tax=Leuconostoc litchii TaxID=1981069 RepID=A0A652NDZ3_9LACO|nr:DUF956 family protein [Leuconostoc litchii]TYC46485.1 DUF956 family protein [Leuconostoc litchii]GMA70199.1 PTS mannose transporter accessory protein ManO [Leuconostoc litchii]